MKEKERIELLANTSTLYVRGVEGSILRRLCDLEDKLGNVSPLGGVSIKDCPKCKHSVLAESTCYAREGYPEFARFADCFLCLTCGCKFTCSNECVCKEVE